MLAYWTTNMGKNIDIFIINWKSSDITSMDSIEYQNTRKYLLQREHKLLLQNHREKRESYRSK